MNHSMKPAGTLLDKPLEVCRDHFLLNIRADGEQFRPGQFVNIRVSGRYDPLLRRPFSVFSRDGDVIGIVIKRVGRGTALLAEMPPGPVDMIGPLGTGFTIASNKKILIVGGGVGNSPLHFLARELTEQGCSITYLYGASTHSGIFLADRYTALAERFIITTDDGSEGGKGFVTDAAAEILAAEKFDFMYACGPRKMMETLSAMARGIPLEVSVENYFGCGIGACSGCTIETSGGQRRACVDGPVFDGASINWAAMPD